MALPVFTAGQKLRASDLNSIGAVGQLVAAFTSGSGDTLNWTTTEAVGTVLATVPFVSGRKYKVEFSGEGNASSAGANMFLKLRYKAGSTVDTSGTLVPGAAIAPNIARGNAGDNNTVFVRGYVTAPTTGNYVIVLTGKMSTGTGSCPADGTPNHLYMISVTCVDV